MTDRYEPYRNVAQRASVDAIALVPGANFSRLFGKEFHQNERPLLVVIPAIGAPAAVVPNLELASFEQIGFEGEVFDWRDQTGYQSAFESLLQHLPLGSVGVEGQVMRVFIDQALRNAAPGLTIRDAQQSISALRLRKNEEEISIIRKAIGISERALANTIDAVKVGMTERAIENILVQNLFAEGAEDFAFSPIVAAAENSARPHAHSRDDYAVKPGDSLLIDFGARAGGLCADITRTFFIQHCTDARAEVYQTVLAANLAGHAASIPGATAHDVDDATTRVLEESAFASRIRHKTGHGMGRDIHEDPYIMRGNEQKLEPGMVFTIEPGLYDLNDIGVRIEDDVLITTSGSESLTSFDKTLTYIG
ncbi:putative dipeptidase PepE [Granulosicoccus antarcticus IMCC3135]|uniref:Putative dipeptidase PepE n=2 Tax=Granulosicoccus TaxID=437504 RepID=A0A2Z2NN38_9GAMM|nr:putative dipeptidase PepE [Granulosicoccus antarcticus IMCC3135]